MKDAAELTTAEGAQLFEQALQSIARHAPSPAIIKVPKAGTKKPAGKGGSHR